MPQHFRLVKTAQGAAPGRRVGAPRRGLIPKQSRSPYVRVPDIRRGAISTLSIDISQRLLASTNPHWRFTTLIGLSGGPPHHAQPTDALGVCVVMVVEVGAGDELNLTDHRVRVGPSSSYGGY